MTDDPIRVLIADDQAVVRAGLRTLLELHEDLEVVGEAGTGRDVLALVRRHRPDVVVMDLRMPVMDGLTATRHLAALGERVRVLVLTTYGMDDNVYAALKAGAAGFVLKTDPPDRLISAVRMAAQGDVVLGPTTTRQLVDQFIAGRPGSSERPVAWQRLTDREREVLTLMGQALSNAEIAVRLRIGEGTVKTHVARVLTKLGLRDRVQAVVFFYENRLDRRD